MQRAAHDGHDVDAHHRDRRVGEGFVQILDPPRADLHCVGPARQRGHGDQGQHRDDRPAPRRVVAEVVPRGKGRSDFRYATTLAATAEMT